MNRRKFAHFSDVFAFTFRQGSKGKAFAVMTYVIPIIIFAVMILINVLIANGQKETPKVTEKVYVIDQTGTDLAASVIEAGIDRKQYPDLKIEATDKTDAGKVCDDVIGDNTKEFVIKVELDEQTKKITLTAVVPEWCTVSSSEYEDINDMAAGTMAVLKVKSSGVDIRSLKYLSSNVVTSANPAGEEPEEFGVRMLKMLAPAVFSLLMYFILILYGQSTGRVVAIEKSSKLMEDFLTTIHPRALVTGKVCAMSIMSISQIVLWVLGGYAGYFVGDVIADKVNPGYTNYMGEFLARFVENSASAFTPLSILMAVVAVFAGVLFFEFIAGLLGSLVSKPEELSNYVGLFNIFVMIGFFGSYFPILMENGSVKSVIRFIPFTAAFVLPADLAVGNIGYLMGALALGVLVLSSFIVAILAAKIYEARVFYKGKNVFQALSSAVKKGDRESST